MGSCVRGGIGLWVCLLGLLLAVGEAASTGPTKKTGLQRMTVSRAPRAPTPPQRAAPRPPVAHSRVHPLQNAAASARFAETRAQAEERALMETLTKTMSMSLADVSLFRRMGVDMKELAKEALKSMATARADSDCQAQGEKDTGLPGFCTPSCEDKSVDFDYNGSQIKVNQRNTGKCSSGGDCCYRFRTTGVLLPADAPTTAPPA